MPLYDRRPAVRPSVILDRNVVRPRAAVLVLHGERPPDERPQTLRHLPAARIRPFVRAVLRATDGHRVMVGQVHYRRQNLAGEGFDPAWDAHRTLDEFALLTGSVPVVLVGHSLGGRAALFVGGNDLVSGVVGLAAWCPEDEPVSQLAGRGVVLLHGDRDQVTDPQGSARLAVRARNAGARSCAVLLNGGDHIMLRRASTWRALATTSVTALLGLGPFPDTVAQALQDGENPVGRV